jgi:hypothetical protein
MDTFGNFLVRRTVRQNNLMALEPETTVTVVFLFSKKIVGNPVAQQLNKRGKPNTMYRDYVTTQEEAICHLFFHCCLKDEVFKEPELDQVAWKIIGFGLRSELNVKEEIMHYTTYKPTISDENAYLEYLITLIKPVNELALYSYCLELMLSDSSFDLSEEVLTDKIATFLKIEDNERDVIKKLIAQRRVVEIDKLF